MNQNKVVRCLRCGGQGDLSTGIQEVIECHVCKGKGFISNKLMTSRLQKEIRYGLRGRKHTKEMIDWLNLFVEKTKYKFLHKI